MRLLRSYPLMAFALVLLSIVAVCLAQNNVGLLIVSGALAALSWYVTEGPRSKHLPRWVSNVLVLAVSLHVVVDLMQNRHDVLGVLGRFIVLLTLIKLYERRTARDHAQLLTLSLLLMVTGSLQSADLMFGGLLIVYAVLGVYVLLLHQLYAAYDEYRRGRLESMPSGYRLAPSLRPVTGRHVRRQFRASVAALGVIGMALSVVVFVLFPRGVGSELIPQLQGPSASRRPGFTESIDLLTGTRITESRSVALDVTLLNELDEPMDYGRPLLLRGSVLSRYRGEGRWSPQSFDARVIHLDGDSPVSLTRSTLSPGRTLRVVVEPYLQTEVLFAPMLPVAVEHSTAPEIRFDRSSQIVRTARQDRSDEYTVSFRPMASDAVLEEMGVPARPVMEPDFEQRWRDDARRVLSRMQSIAVDLLAAAGVAATPPTDEPAQQAWVEQAARVFLNELQSDRFSYTLDLSDVVLTAGADPDPVIQFITETRRGHCEYFASAMTLLCQSVGIDARVVTGFVAYEYNPPTQSYLVLQSNAHAWVEVRTGPRRYTTFDPTPPASLREMHANASTLTDRLRWVYERFDGAWSEQIIEFDRDAQQTMTRTIDKRWSQRLSDALEAARQWAANVNRSFRLGPAGYIWLGIVALAVAIAVVAAVKVIRRFMRIRRRTRLEHIHGSEHRRLLRQLGFYVDMLEVLQRARLDKPSWQPPLMFAAAVQGEQPAAGASMREISELFYAARFGGQPLSRDDVMRARRAVAELARQLHVKVPQ